MKKTLRYSFRTSEMVALHQRGQATSLNRSSGDYGGREKEFKGRSVLLY